MSGGGRKRGLTNEDRDLWKEITKSVRPLSGRRRTKIDEPDGVAGEMPFAKGAEAVKRPVAAPPVKKRVTPPPLAPIDRRTVQRVSRGAADIDARLDLHGYTQAEAKSRLLRFLETAQTRGHALVLVITGKGKPDAKAWDRETGILRRQVPLWLALPEFRGLVIGFEESARRHGGAGALYIRVRKRR